MFRFLLILALPLYCVDYSFANVFRVNNSLATSASQKIYKSIQEAHDAAATGDTLMIEGASIEYAGATITKALVLIGPGYFLSQNPQTQANPAAAVIQAITINATAKNTVLSGLFFSLTYSNNTIYIQADNVIVKRCYLSYPINITSTVNNIIVAENYFVGIPVSVPFSNSSFTGLSLTNNYIGGDLIIPTTNTYQRIFSTVENNIFNGGVSFTTSTFRSNIITNTTAAFGVSSSAIQNNLAAGSGQLPTGNGNQTYNAANLFIGAIGNSTDGQYKLKTNSPYLTAGYNSAQPGIFGGTQPYVLSGQPPIPAIYEFTADGFVNKQNGLPINIKVKANQ